VSLVSVAPSSPSDLRRRDEILDTAAQLFASQGLRTSLQEIADACGIQPGSLYHHFESKEAIVVELIARYHGEVDRLAQARRFDDGVSDASAARERLLQLSTAIAQCAARHSAAVQFTFYDPPGGASDELVRLARRPPDALEATMRRTLEAGRKTGFIRSGLDLSVVSDRICQTMLHVGLGLFHRYPAERVAPVLCGILLDGLATDSPSNSQLDRSAALTAVKEVIKTWPKADDPDPHDRAAVIHAAARSEFGRRGYEVTTVRDIAAAAGLGTGSVYRVIGSKEELLTSIMREFSDKAAAGWSAALGSDATVVEKLDAVAWLQINVMERFYDEFKIQLAWLRQVPPDIPSIGWSFAAVMRRLKDELATGVRAGDVSIHGASAGLTARCVLEMTWIPETIIRGVGKRNALVHARDTLLRGVAVRRSRG